MKRIYIITETGRAWGNEGMNWIETVFKPSANEPEQLLANMGALYNSPRLLLNELIKHPDSYVLLSYEHIDVLGGTEVQAFCQLLRTSIESGDASTSWQILKEYVDRLCNE